MAFRVGQVIGASSCKAGSIGSDFLDHLARGIACAAHHYRVLAVVDDFKDNTCKVGVALGSSPGLTVVLLHRQTTAHHIVVRIYRVGLFICGNCHSLLPKGQQHGLISGFLPQGIPAISDRCSHVLIC